MLSGQFPFPHPISPRALDAHCAGHQLTKTRNIRANLSVPRCSPLVEKVDSAADADVEHDEDGHGGEARRRQGMQLGGMVFLPVTHSFSKLCSFNF